MQREIKTEERYRCSEKGKDKVQEGQKIQQSYWSEVQEVALTFKPKLCLPGLSIPGFATLTGAALAVGEDVLQPLLQLIRPFPLQVQLPLEVLELWGNRGKDGG